MSVPDKERTGVTSTSGHRTPLLSRAARRVVTVLVLALAMLGAGVAGATAENWRRDASHDNKIAIGGCVIRFDQRDAAGNTAPYIHANEAHMCVGVTGLEVEPDGDLVLFSDTVGPIVSLSVSPDETMSRLGLSCGASGGSHRTTIRCYDRNGNKVDADSPEMYAPYSNLWVTWFTWQDD